MLALVFAAALTFPSIGWELPADGKQQIIDAGAAFESAAVSWTSADPLALRVRVSSDGREWSEWMTPEIDADSSDASTGRQVTGIIHFGVNAQYIEYAFDGVADHVSLTMFPPHAQRKLHTESLSVGPLSVRSRVEWGCPEGEGSGWTPVYTTVTHAVVHHTAGANSVRDWDAELRSIWLLHTVTNGWGDIGYNYLIDPDGVIYEGRAGGNGAIGAHFSCRNTNTVGVALLGTYSTAWPTPAAMTSLRLLLGELVKRNAIDPTAMVRHVPSDLVLPTIIGHRDGNTSKLTCTVTECPGEVLYGMLPWIRHSLVPQERRRAAGH